MPALEGSGLVRGLNRDLGTESANGRVRAGRRQKELKEEEASDCCPQMGSEDIKRYSKKKVD